MCSCGLAPLMQTSPSMIQVPVGGVPGGDPAGGGLDATVGVALPRYWPSMYRPLDR